MAKLPHEPDGATFAEIGAELGVSRERARQIEQQALRKLAVILERRGLTLEDLLPTHPGGGEPSNPRGDD